MFAFLIKINYTCSLLYFSTSISPYLYFRGTYIYPSCVKTSYIYPSQYKTLLLALKVICFVLIERKYMPHFFFLSRPDLLFFHTQNTLSFYFEDVIESSKSIVSKLFIFHLPQLPGLFLMQRKTRFQQIQFAK